MGQKTRSIKPAEIERNWYVVSARGKTLGRLAAQVAAVLRGKHKPSYTPHLDCGDFVIITDAERVRLTGNKREDKIRHWHTGYPGHLRSASYGSLLEKEPEKVIRRAVQGMLPHNPLGRQVLRKLKVYRGPDHDHGAQQPEPLPEA
ncbi:MAG TPA: 50S ribosomal protein L13 [Armatimonadota bacterium]|nr:50S ribosomal protein L13 [Armatimonadota bacterium]